MSKQVERLRDLQADLLTNLEDLLASRGQLVAFVATVEADNPLADVALDVLATVEKLLNEIKGLTGKRMGRVENVH